MSPEEREFLEEMSHCPECGTRVPVLMRPPLPWEYEALRCARCVRLSTVPVLVRASPPRTVQ